MEDHVMKRLVASIKCGSCGQPYSPDGIEVIERKDELWFLKALCTSCHVGVLVAAIIREESSPEIFTDLTETELEKFRELGTVSEDDLLDMHGFLKDFHGDIPRLFRQEE